jgi:6-phosphogluconate dehydrogenase
MQLGMIGLGRMGGNMARRLLAADHRCVVYARSREAIDALVEYGATGVGSISEMIAALTRPRVVWVMIPAAAVDDVIAEVAPLLGADDVIIDGGNSHFGDDIRRARDLRERRIHYVDVGVSGGIWGLENGYCQMIGGDAETVARLEPLFAALAPKAAGDGASGVTPAKIGYLHCGPSGAGHFVKMVHNGIEYGIMAAYAEGFNILRQANVGSSAAAIDAETSPLRKADQYRYELDVAAIAEVWRHGSVVRSWLLDLAAHVLEHDAELSDFVGAVSDSGEGRWTIAAAIDAGVPAPVLAAALFGRFSSRGNDDFANRVLSALRHQFGGHAELDPSKGTTQ